MCLTLPAFCQISSSGRNSKKFEIRQQHFPNGRNNEVKENGKKDLGEVEVSVGYWDCVDQTLTRLADVCGFVL